jgi:hypothetical protein
MQRVIRAIGTAPAVHFFTSRYHTAPKNRVHAAMTSSAGPGIHWITK